MPMLIGMGALLPALIGAAATTGISLYEGSQQRDAAKEQAAATYKAQQDALAKQAQQQALANQKLVAGNLPNAISQTGGYLTQTGDLGLAGAQSGLPGAAFSGYGQGALSQFLGQGGETTPSLSAATSSGPTGALTALTQLPGLQGQQQEPYMNMMQSNYGICGGTA